MKKTCLMMLVIALALACAAPALAGGSNKVDVCHLPPGNPFNWHTITISEKALPAHLAHGDLEGSCLENCEALCDDGDACTQDVQADAEECVCWPAAPRPPVDCDDGNPCTQDSCDAIDGCLYDTEILNGTPCDDGDPGTSDDQCNSGVCSGTAPLQIEVNFSAQLVDVRDGFKDGTATGTFGVFTVSSFPQTIAVDVNDIVLVGDLNQPSGDGTFTSWSAASGLSILFNSPTSVSLVGSVRTETPLHACGGLVACQWILNPGGAATNPNTAEYRDTIVGGGVSGVGPLVLTTVIP